MGRVRPAATRPPGGAGGAPTRARPTCATSSSWARTTCPSTRCRFPATILGSGEPWKLVDYIKSFNYLNYEGGKFSTSEGRGVFMDQALEILPADYWRWWLMANVPEGSDSNFTWESFQAQVNKDLADVLGNFVSRVTKFAAARFGDAVPDGGAYGPAEEARRRRDRAPGRRLRGASGRDRAPQGGAGAAGDLGGRQRVPAGGGALDRDQDRPRPRRGDHPVQPEPDPAPRRAEPAVPARRLGRDAGGARPRGRRLARRRRRRARGAAARPPLRRCRRCCSPRSTTRRAAALAARFAGS